MLHSWRLVHHLGQMFSLSPSLLGVVLDYLAMGHIVRGGCCKFHGVLDPSLLVLQGGQMVACVGLPCHGYNVRTFSKQLDRTCVLQLNSLSVRLQGCV